MEVKENELSIGSSKPPRAAIPAASYEAAYRNLTIKSNEKGYGGKPEKFAKLFFVITKGEHAGKTVSYRGNFFHTDEGEWIIGGKSNLAEAIRAISRGGTILNESHKGLKCVVTVKNKTGDKGVYDFVDTVVAVPSDDTKVDVEALIKHHTGGDTSFPPAESRKPAGAAPKTAAQGDMLTDITDLSDFEAA